jgi:hypothetical protein
MDITTILMVLFVIIGGYLLTTDQIEGTSKLVLTIFVVIITVIVVINLPMFNSFYTFNTAPVGADKPLKIVGTTYKASSSSYSLSTWIYISDWNVNYGAQKPLIQRKIQGMNNPYMYLDNNVNNLMIEFATFNTSAPNTGINNVIKIENISIQKWVNITVCFGDKTVDTYINGKLVNTYVTNNPQYVIPQTSTVTNPDFTITGAPGFSGSTANTRYYDRFLTPQDAWDIYTGGFNNNWLNQFNASFTFYQNQNEKAKFYML